MRRSVARGAPYGHPAWHRRTTAGLTELANVTFLAHPGSATLQTRATMARMAAKNRIAELNGQTPPSRVGS
jgi:lactate dehydrogenase-like 2-hydroxyacid dehydrogenase